MATITRTRITQKDILAHDTERAVMFFHAYRECTPPVQKLIDEMTEIIVSEDVSGDEKTHAIDVVIEALFPVLTEEVVEFDDEFMESDAARNALALLDREEATFAEKLKSLMAERGLTQEQLADLTGVSQPAICNMLNRTCRPQKRTIARFASALNVEPDELWPSDL